MLVRSAHDADRDFAELIGDVERGETGLITKDARTVAEVRPVVIEDRTQDPVWRAGYEHMMAMLENKPDYGIGIGEITEAGKYGDAAL